MVPPVCINHPIDENEDYISANSPEMAETVNIGTVYNTTVDSKGTMRCEFWLNKARATELGFEDIITNFEDGEMMEVSTGLWSDDVLKSGEDQSKISKYVTNNKIKKLDLKANEYQGEAFGSIAINFRPDHIALLPDKVGACSIEDGCGALRDNNKDSKKKKNCGCENCVAKLNEVQTVTFKMKSKLTGAMNHFLGHCNKQGIKLNELSHEDIRSQLRAEAWDAINPSDDEWLWIMEVYDDYFIIEYQGSYHKLTYSISGDIVTIGDTMTEVYRKTIYEAIPQGTSVSGNTDTKSKEGSMTKADLIKSILANETNQFSETELNNFDESILKKLIPNANKKEDEMETEDNKEEDSETKSSKSNSDSDPDANVSEGGLADQVKSLTKQVKTLTESHTSTMTEIRELVVNNYEHLTESMVKGMSDSDVKELADKIRPQANYAGRGGANTQNNEGSKLYKTSSVLSK